MAHYAANLSDRLRTVSVLWWLAGVNTAVFVVLTALSFIDPTVAAEWLALPDAPASLAHRPWTVLSYMVTHIDFLHLLFNMLWLLWFGALLLHVVPQRRLLAIYAGGGLAGALLFMVLSIVHMTPPQPLMGASASVLAIMTAAGCLMPSYRLHLFFIGDVKLKWVVPAMILLSLLGTWGGNIGGLAAHMGGVAYGLAYGFASRRRDAGKRFGIKRETVRRPTKAGARRVASILEQNRLDKARLDELLDKIKMSGYESLTRRERSELDDISRRISK